MTKLYVARFSNGREIKRSTANRTYTHAYLAHGKVPAEVMSRYPDHTGFWEKWGFSASETQCRKNMEAETAYYQRNGYTRDFAEIAPVEQLK